MNKAEWNNSDIINLGKNLCSAGVSYYNAIYNAYNTFRQLSENKYWEGKNHNIVASYMNEFINEFEYISKYLSIEVPTVISKIAQLQAQDGFGEIADIISNMTSNVDIKIPKLNLTEEKATGDIKFNKNKINEFLSGSSKNSFSWYINNKPDGIIYCAEKYLELWIQDDNFYKNDESIKDVQNIIERYFNFVDKKAKEFDELIKREVNLAKKKIEDTDEDAIKYAKEFLANNDPSNLNNTSATLKSFESLIKKSPSSLFIKSKAQTNKSLYDTNRENGITEPKNFYGWGSTKGDGIQMVYTVNGKSYNVYCQGSGNYSNTQYWQRDDGSWGTIKSSGCGITSTAIILSGYGHDATPLTVMNDGLCPNGNDQNNYIKELNKYGIEAHCQWTELEDTAINNLKEGRPVIVSVKDGTVGNESYTGHYLTLLGMNSEGKIFVGDPGSDKNSGYFDSDKVFSPAISYTILIDN